METTQKPVAKFKPFFSLGTAILFVMLGAYLYFNVSVRPGTEYPTIIKIVGACNMVFFGAIATLALVKIFRRG